MRKILEDLYFGNIVPYEERIAAGSELRRLVKCAADCEARLAEQLSDSEKQTLDNPHQHTARNRQHHGEGIFYPGFPVRRQIDDRVHG